MKRHTNLLIAAMFAAFPLCGQTTLSLDSVVGQIRAHHPLLKAFEQRSSAMHTYASGADALIAPEVGGGLWMLPYRTVDDPRDKGQIMLSVQQRVTSGTRRRAQGAFMGSKASLEEATRDATFNELRAQARYAYRRWQVLERKIKVLKEGEQLITLVLQVAKSRYPYGQAALGEVYRAEGRLEELHNMQLTNDLQIHHEHVLLNQLMNRPPETPFRIDTTLVLGSRAALAPDTTALTSQRSDVRRLDYTIRSLRMNQELERSTARPDFTLSFNHMFARGAGMPNQFMLLGMVSIPIAPWSSRGYKRNVEALEQEIASVKMERQALVNELQGRTVSAASEFEVLGRQLENYERRIIPALRRNLDVTLLEWQENRGELPMVLEAWEALNASRLQYLDTMTRYFEAQVEYEKQLEQ